VQESFNEANQAQQEKEKLINEAQPDYNKLIPLAVGEKESVFCPRATAMRPESAPTGYAT